MRLFLAIAALCLSMNAAALEISSTSFNNGDRLPLKHVFDSFGCEGNNLSPQLSWTGAPEGTKSFAITAYDPDAPTGSGWWHWVMFNIPTHASELVEGTILPIGAVESRTDYGTTGYGGACPPQGHGTHHYHFTIHALDVATLDLDETTPAAMVGYFLHQHGLAKATITATYSRD